MMRRLSAPSFLVAGALLLAACTSSGAASSPSPVASATPASAVPAEAGDGSGVRTAEVPSRAYVIVAIGDVYSAGTGTDVPRRDSWPAQVAGALEQHGEMRIDLRNLAEKSVHSDEVIQSQLAYVAGFEPDVVTVQVGVDDIVSGEADAYAANMAYIFGELLQVLPPERIFAITTPDHTLTEWGRASGTRGTAEDVDRLNDTLLQVAADRDITVIDIGPINERVTVDEELVVRTDPPYPPKPYPTAKQYAAWAQLIAPYIRQALETIEP